MSQVDIYEYIELVDSLIDESHFSQAILHARNILSQYPRHLESYRLMGRAYLEQGRLTEASDMFRRVLSVDPDDLIAHIALAQVAENGLLGAQALWHLDRAYEIEPNNADIAEERVKMLRAESKSAALHDGIPITGAVRMLLRGGQYQQALVQLSRLPDRDPERHEVKLLKMEALWHLQRYEEAVSLAQQVLEDLPWSIGANAVAADVANRVGNETAAASYYKKLQSLLLVDQNHLEMESMVGRILSKVQDRFVPTQFWVEQQQTADDTYLPGGDPWASNEINDQEKEGPESSKEAFDWILENVESDSFEDEQIETEDSSDRVMGDWLTQLQPESNRLAADEPNIDVNFSEAEDDVDLTLAGDDNALEAEAWLFDEDEESGPLDEGESGLADGAANEVMPDWLRNATGQDEPEAAEPSEWYGDESDPEHGRKPSWLLESEEILDVEPQESLSDELFDEMSDELLQDMSNVPFQAEELAEETEEETDVDLVKGSFEVGESTEPDQGDNQGIGLTDFLGDFSFSGTGGEEDDQTAEEPAAAESDEDESKWLFPEQRTSQDEPLSLTSWLSGIEPENPEEAAAENDFGDDVEPDEQVDSLPDFELSFDEPVAEEGQTTVEDTVNEADEFATLFEDPDLLKPTPAAGDQGEEATDEPQFMTTGELDSIFALPESEFEVGENDEEEIEPADLTAASLEQEADQLTEGSDFDWLSGDGESFAAEIETESRSESEDDSSGDDVDFSGYTTSFEAWVPPAEPTLQPADVQSSPSADDPIIIGQPHEEEETEPKLPDWLLDDASTTEEEAEQASELDEMDSFLFGDGAGVLADEESDSDAQDEMLSWLSEGSETADPSSEGVEEGGEDQTPPQSDWLPDLSAGDVTETILTEEVAAEETESSLGWLSSIENDQDEPSPEQENVWAPPSETAGSADESLGLTDMLEQLEQQSNAVPTTFEEKIDEKDSAIETDDEEGLGLTDMLNRLDNMEKSPVDASEEILFDEVLEANASGDDDLVKELDDGFDFAEPSQEEDQSDESDLPPIPDWLSEMSDPAAISEESDAESAEISDFLSEMKGNEMTGRLPELPSQGGGQDDGVTATALPWLDSPQGDDSAPDEEVEHTEGEDAEPLPEWLQVVQSNPDTDQSAEEDLSWLSMLGDDDEPDPDEDDDLGLSFLQDNPPAEGATADGAEEDSDSAEDDQDNFLGEDPSQADLSSVDDGDDSEPLPDWLTEMAADEDDADLSGSENADLEFGESLEGDEIDPDFFLGEEINLAAEQPVLVSETPLEAEQETDNIDDEAEVGSPLPDWLMDDDEETKADQPSLSDEENTNQDRQFVASSANTLENGVQAEDAGSMNNNTNQPGQTFFPDLEDDLAFLEQLARNTLGLPPAAQSMETLVDDALPVSSDETLLDVDLGTEDPYFSGEDQADAPIVDEADVDLEIDTAGGDPLDFGDETLVDQDPLSWLDHIEPEEGEDLDAAEEPPTLSWDDTRPPMHDAALGSVEDIEDLDSDESIAESSEQIFEDLGSAAWLEEAGEVDTDAIIEELTVDHVSDLSAAVDGDPSPDVVEEIDLEELMMDTIIEEGIDLDPTESFTDIASEVAEPAIDLVDEGADSDAADAAVDFVDEGADSDAADTAIDFVDGDETEFDDGEGQEPVEAVAESETKAPAQADDDEFRVSAEEIAHAAEHGIEIEGFDFELSDDPDALLSWLNLDEDEADAVDEVGVVDEEDDAEGEVDDFDSGVALVDEPADDIEDQDQSPDVANVEAVSPFDAPIEEESVEGSAAEVDDRESSSSSVAEDDFHVSAEEIAHAAEHGIEIEGLDLGLPDSPEAMMAWLDISPEDEGSERKADAAFLDETETVGEIDEEDDMTAEMPIISETMDVSTIGEETDGSELAWLDDLTLEDEGEEIDEEGIETQFPYEDLAEDLPGDVPTIVAEEEIDEEESADSPLEIDEDDEGGELVAEEDQTPLDSLLDDTFDDEEGEDLGWLDELTPMNFDEVLELDSDMIKAEGIDTVFPDLPAELTDDEAESLIADAVDSDLVRNEIGDLPDDPDEALAILEKLAAEQRSDEDGEADQGEGEAQIEDGLDFGTEEMDIDIDFPDLTTDTSAVEETVAVEDDDIPVPTIIQNVSDAMPDWLESSDDNEGILDWLEKDDDGESLDWLQAEEQASQVAANMPKPRTGPLPELPDDFPDPTADEEIDSPFVADPGIAESEQRIEIDPALFAAPRAALEANDIERATEAYTGMLEDGSHIEQLIAELEHQVEGKHRHPFLMRLLGDAYMQGGELQKALDTYSRVQDLL